MSEDTTNIGEPSLVFEHVSKWYGSIAALTDVTFRVGREVTGLVGKNGVGKSTLMKLAVGLLAPSQGRVTVAGHPSGSVAARAAVGFCPDVERLFDDLPATTFVAWMLRYHGLSPKAADARSREVLTELGLAENMHRRIRDYSKGMRQRVRLAQALAHRPTFVLLDEPMTGLDPLARAELSQQIRELPARGVGVLVSSHVLHELEAIVDRVVMVHQGRLLAEGRLADLRNQLPARQHRVRIRGARVRDLAARLIPCEHVVGVEIVDGAIEVRVTGEAGFYRALTELGATWDGGLQEVRPLDDDLAAVYGHLVR